MRNARIIVLALIAVLAATPSRAERWLVGTPQLGPVRTVDSPGYGSRALPTVPPGLLEALAPPPASNAAYVPLPPASWGPLPGLDPAQPFRGQGDLDRFLEPLTPPDPAFAAELTRVYSIIDPAETAAVWRWFTGESAGLALRERVGNAMVRYMLATGRFTPEARVDGFRSDATQARVRSSNGVSLRSSPWGPSFGELPGGASIRVIPPADGIWYRVQTGAGEGWACGLYLDAR